jgi:hypothetical protein
VQVLAYQMMHASRPLAVWLVTHVAEFGADWLKQPGRLEPPPTVHVPIQKLVVAYGLASPTLQVVVE